jgi:hypothetical protein
MTVQMMDYRGEREMSYIESDVVVSVGSWVAGS